MPRVPKCIVCKVPLPEYSPKAGNVKCSQCRKTEPRNQIGDIEGKVACRLCGAARKRLSNHLKTQHSMSPEAYLQQFTEALLEVPRKRHSVETKKKQAQAASLRWTSPEERAAQSLRLQEHAPWKGKKLSLVMRKAISEGGLGKKHLLSEDTKREVGQRGREVLLRMHSMPGHQERFSQGQLKKYRVAKTRGVLFGLQVKETWQKGYQTRLQRGTLNPLYAGRGVVGFRQGITHFCRSTFEANFARILLLEGVQYDYEPQIFKLRSGKTYTPDFYLHSPLSGIPAGWVELKGWRYANGSLPDGVAEKVQGFEEATAQNLFVLTMDDLLWVTLQTKYAISIPLWETARKNLRTHPQLFGRGI